MQLFCDISHLLTMFQMSYILSSGYNSGLKILLKTYVLSIHHMGIKQSL